MDEALKRRKYRALKVAITEFFMVLTVVALVFTLTFIVLGYKIGEEGELEQDGFLQIKTFPTGANVEIDGKGLLSKTNLSKAISAGEHTIRFSREGYDDWEKNILITSGLTYRLEYPKLFLLDREKETIANFEDLNYVSISPNYNFMVVATNSTQKWQLIYLDEDEPRIEDIKIAEAFPEIKTASSYNIRIVKWDDDSDKILAVMELNGRREWVFVDIKKVENSKNLTQEFGMNFADVKIKNKSGEQLFVLENGNLRTLNITSGEVSRVLLTNVESFYNFDSNIIYAGRDEDGKREIGFYQEGNNSGKKIIDLDDKSVVKFAAGEYYGDNYMVFAIDNKVTIYRGAFGQKLEKDVLLVDETLDYNPSEVTVRGGGELIMLRAGKSYAMYDVETNKFSRYELEDEKIEWINDFMFSFVDENGDLIIEDFDKGNRKKLSSDVASGFKTTITADKWLYYIDAKGNLIREKIAE